jgi:hypothetical protein
MKVKDLIKLLKKQPQDIEVAYACCSEQCLLEADDISVERLCKARPDGWIQNSRADKEMEDYLLFPGN